MSRPLLACLLLVSACKHSTSSSSTSHTETSTVTDATSSESGATTTVTTTSEAPGKTTTTVEEFQPPVIDSDPAQAGSARQTASPEIASGIVAHRSARPEPVLVKRTVTVTEHGQETTQTRQEATTQGQGASETRAAAKVDTQAQAAESSKPALSCVSLGWIGALILLAVAFVAWRLLKP